MTSTATDLTGQLRRRLETERREIEELTASELKHLDENSRRAARNALSTIERDTEGESSGSTFWRHAWPSFSKHPPSRDRAASVSLRCPEPDRDRGPSR